jgi:hypothetical protein
MRRFSLLMSSLFTGVLLSSMGGIARAESLDPSPDSKSSSSGGSSCEVNYTLDNAGTITTGWINLGQVSFPNKRSACKGKAEAACAAAKAKLPVYAPVGSATMQAICNQGYINVYFDTRVGGNVKYTRDGSCRAPVACTRQPCPPWTGYSP